MQLNKKNIQNEESFVSRIIVKFYDKLGIDYRNENDILEILFRQDSAGQWKNFTGLYPPVQIDKLFTSVSTHRIIELVNKARALDPTYDPPDLLSYYVFSFPGSIRPNGLLSKLSAFREVELAYLQSAAMDPDGVADRRRSLTSGTHLD